MGVAVAPEPARGDVYGATFPVGAGDPRKYVLVVSNNAINAAMDPVVVRLTAEDRHRTLPTTVELTDEDRARASLPAKTWALCHEVVTMPLRDLDPAPKGDITLGTMIEVERALLRVLDLEEPPARGA
jgi:mRNA-degrading endonuclease toxin of MazEF toxin-antitoxin module